MRDWRIEVVMISRRNLFGVLLGAPAAASSVKIAQPVPAEVLPPVEWGTDESETPEEKELSAYVKATYEERRYRSLCAAYAKHGFWYA